MSRESVAFVELARQKEAEVPKRTYEEWIKVSDRYPPDLIEVLIVIEGIIYIGGHDRREDGGWWSADCSFDDADQDKVTHWMPLPKLPEVE